MRVNAMRIKAGTPALLHRTPASGDAVVSRRLPGRFNLPDSAPFEEWAQAQREHLRQRALSALDRLRRATEWRGQSAQAIGYARQQVTLDPLNEAGQRANSGCWRATVSWLLPANSSTICAMRSTPN